MRKSTTIKIHKFESAGARQGSIRLRRHDGEGIRCLPWRYRPKLLALAIIAEWASGTFSS